VQHEKDFIQAQRAGASAAVAPQFRDSKSYRSIPADGPVSTDVAVTDPAPALRQGAGPMPAATVGRQAGDGGFSYNLPVKVFPDAIIILIARAPIRWVHTLDAGIRTGREHG
jgi:hypothetical protein